MTNADRWEKRLKVELLINAMGVLMEVSFFYHTLGVAWSGGIQFYCINNARVAEYRHALDRKRGRIYA